MIRQLKPLLVLLLMVALLTVGCASGGEQTGPAPGGVAAEESEVEESAAEENTAEESAAEESATEEAAPEEGPIGTLTVGLDLDPLTFDPPVAASPSNKSISDHIFDPLIIRTFPSADAGMELTPGLATEWTNIDDTTWELKLREGVTFHNGEAFDAEDVKFTIDRILDPEEEIPSRTQFEMITGVEIVDPYTVRITTAAPSPTLVRVLTDMWILPADYGREVGSEGLATQPIGTGAFRFVEHIKDSELRLEANTAYWGEIPKIKELVFKPFPDAATRANALLSGTVDVMMALPPIEISRVESTSGYEIVSSPSVRVYFINIHTFRDTPLQDARVRQALNYAVDKQAILDSLYGGRGRVLSSPLTPMHFGYHPDLEPYPYDPDRARELLAEAGYPDGFEIDFGAPSGRYPLDKEAAQAVEAQLADVGVQANLEISEWGNYLTMFREDTIPTLHYFGWGFPYFDADQTLYSLFIKDANVYGRYGNPDIVPALEEARSSLDEEVRLENYHQVQEVIHEEAPWLFLYQLDEVFAKSTNVQWEPRPDERIWFHEASIEP